MNTSRRPMVNSFQLPNSVVDEILPEITPNALKCYLLIVRLTTGWQKHSDRISIRQLQEKTGLKKRTIQRAMTELIDFKLIDRTVSKGTISEYSVRNMELQTSVNDDTSSSDTGDTSGDEVVSGVTPGSVTGDTGGSVTGDTLQKTFLQKDIFTKGAAPPGLNLEAWQKWIDYRKKTKLRKYTTDQKAIQLSELRAEDQMRCVEHSIDNSYSGIFPEKFQGNTTRMKSQQEELDEYFFAD